MNRRNGKNEKTLLFLKKDQGVFTETEKNKKLELIENRDRLKGMLQKTGPALQVPIFLLFLLLVGCSFNQETIEELENKVEQLQGELDAKTDLEKKVEQLQGELDAKTDRVRRLYQVTPEVLDELSASNKTKYSKLVENLKKYAAVEEESGKPKVFEEEKFKRILDEAIDELSLNDKQKLEEANSLKVKFKYAHPTIAEGTQVKVEEMDRNPEELSQFMKGRLVGNSRSVPIVPYNYINYKLHPTRNYAMDGNKKWKRAYAQKVDSYYRTKQTVIDNENDLAQRVSTLGLSFDQLWKYNNNIETKNQQIQALRDALQKEKERVKHQLGEKRFQTVVYAQGSFPNDISKGEAQKALRKEANQLAIEHFNGVYIESLTSITNTEIDATESKSAIAGRIRTISQIGSFDNYDFQDGQQMLYSVFHFEVSTKETSHEEEVTESKSVDLMTQHSDSPVKIKNSVVLDHSNRDSFVFPALIQSRIEEAVQDSKETNENTRLEIAQIYATSRNKINEIVQKLNIAVLERDALVKERDNYGHMVVNARKQDLRNSCVRLEKNQSQSDSLLQIASTHGKQKKDGFLYFVMYGERETTESESADSVTKKLVEELYDKVESRLQSDYLSQVTEVRNFELEKNSLFTQKVQEGDIVESSIVLRTQRRSNLNNYFGIGLMFTIKGRVTIPYQKGTFLDSEQCYLQSIAKAQKRHAPEQSLQNFEVQD